MGHLEDSLQFYDFLNSIFFSQLSYIFILLPSCKKCHKPSGDGGDGVSPNLLPSWSWNPQSSSLVHCSAHQSGLGECN